jgi:hypothetical protein
VELRIKSAVILEALGFFTHACRHFLSGRSWLSRSGAFQSIR